MRGGHLGARRVTVIFQNARRVARKLSSLVSASSLGPKTPGEQAKSSASLMTSPTTSPLTLTYGGTRSASRAGRKLHCRRPPERVPRSSRRSSRFSCRSRRASASLRRPLPDLDATVCGFSVGPDRAIAVPKEKAAAVAYDRSARRGVPSPQRPCIIGASRDPAVSPAPTRGRPWRCRSRWHARKNDGNGNPHWNYRSLVLRAGLRVTPARAREDGSAGKRDNLRGGASNSAMPDGVKTTFRRRGFHGERNHRGDARWDDVLVGSRAPGESRCRPCRSGGGNPRAQRSIPMQRGPGEEVQGGDGASGTWASCSTSPAPHTRSARARARLRRRTRQVVQGHRRELALSVCARLAPRHVPRRTHEPGGGQGAGEGALRRRDGGAADGDIFAARPRGPHV